MTEKHQYPVALVFSSKTSHKYRAALLIVAHSRRSQRYLVTKYAVNRADSVDLENNTIDLGLL